MKYFRELILQGISPVRFLMHRALEKKVRIVSPCVDLGGGKQTYLKYLQYNTNEKIILVDRTPEADIASDLENNLPFSDGSFRTVLMLNVMELIFNFDTLCQEINRILGKNGKAYIWIPFLINIHNQPNDYFRYTDKALKRIFFRSGFSQVDVQAYGGLGLVVGTYLGQLFYGFRIGACLIHLFSFGVNKIINHMKHNANVSKWPLGYFVTAIK